MYGNGCKVKEQSEVGAYRNVRAFVDNFGISSVDAYAPRRPLRHLFLSQAQKPFSKLPSAGLPDFSWYKIPKREKIYQFTMNYTEGP
jgi:hypothetical protein